MFGSFIARVSAGKRTQISFVVVVCFLYRNTRCDNCDVVGTLMLQRDNNNDTNDDIELSFSYLLRMKLLYMFTT